MTLNCWRCGKKIDEVEMFLAQMQMNKNWCFECYIAFFWKYGTDLMKHREAKVKREDLEDTWFNAQIESEAEV